MVYEGTLYEIKPREFLTGDEESPEALQCKRCGTFRAPCKFQKELKKTSVSSTIAGQKSPTFKYIRRDYCFKCPEKESVKNPEIKKKKYTYSEVNSRTCVLEKEFKNMDADMTSMMDVIKSLTQRIVSLESNRDTKAQSGLDSRERRKQFEHGMHEDHSMHSFDS